MTLVLVEVTLAGDVEPERSSDVPPEVLALVAAAPQVQRHGWSKHGRRPWRAQFLVRGPDCIATATSLEQQLRDLGYEADATFWR